MSVIGKSINSVINIVLLIAIFNFAFLIVSVPVAGFITGEEVLSASMGLSHDIDESVFIPEFVGVKDLTVVPNNPSSEL